MTSNELYIKNYQEKLNFKDYERTNCLAYELIMRNKECQKSFFELHKYIKEMTKEREEFLSTKREVDKNEQLANYISKRVDDEKELFNLSYLEEYFLDQLLNYFVIIFNSQTDKEYSEFFKNYIPKKEYMLKNFKYINFEPFLNSYEYIKIKMDKEKYLKHIANCIKIINIYKIKSKYNGKLNTEAITIEINDDDIDLHKFEKWLGREVKGIRYFAEDQKQKILKEIQKDDIFENIFLDYQRIYTSMDDIYQKILNIQDFLNSEFFIDFHSELYLDYDFFPKKMQEDILRFFKNDIKYIYDEEFNNMIDDALYNVKKEIKQEDLKILLTENYFLDKSLMNRLKTTDVHEEIMKHIKEKTSTSIRRVSHVTPIYARPKLFSEKFRTLSIDINPNYNLNEISTLISNIIELYQNNILENKSTLEILGEKFDKWSDTISRKKRKYGANEANNNMGNIKITTLIKNAHILLYVYDQHKKNKTIDNIRIDIIEKTSVGTLTSYLNFARYLIEEKGFKHLLT